MTTSPSICRRFDWFWWGDGDPIHFNIKRRSEIDGRTYENEPAAGIIRNVTISNVIAHGQGTSAIQGHPDSWLEGIRLNHVRLFVSHAPDAPYESTAAAMTLKYARDVAMKDVEIRVGRAARGHVAIGAGSGQGSRTCCSMTRGSTRRRGRKSPFCN